MRGGAGLLAGAAFALQAMLGLAFIRSAAPTFDETVHLAGGYSSLTTGDYRFNAMDHPPLAEMWTALPLLPSALKPCREFRDWQEGRIYHFADQFLYHNTLDAEAMLNRGRIFCLLTWGAALCLLLWRWGSSLGGPFVGAAAAAAAALCPVLVSNFCLTSTDAAPAVFYFATFFLLSRRPPRGARDWAAAGACAGLALASKFSMIVLPPLALGLLAIERRLEKPKIGFDWAGLGVAAGCALLALAAIYRFSHLPLYPKGLVATLARLDQGRACFLLGERSLTGFWLYFPVAFLVKTPLPLLALASAAVGSRLERRERLWLLGPLFGYLVFAMTSKTQIGVRHLLPALPFLCLLAGLGARRFWAGGRHGRAALGVLLGWALLSVSRCSPYLLAYFNELAGGPANGYRVLADSNLDWGQDLKGLAQYLRSIGNPPIFLCYFGVADPAHYGIRYAPVAMAPHVERAGSGEDPAASGRTLLAISATNLQGVYYADRGLWAWLKERRPAAVIGYSIFVYDLTADAEALGAVRRLLPDGFRE